MEGRHTEQDCRVGWLASIVSLLHYFMTYLYCLLFELLQQLMRRRWPDLAHDLTVRLVGEMLVLLTRKHPRQKCDRVRLAWLRPTRARESEPMWG